MMRFLSFGAVGIVCIVSVVLCAIIGIELPRSQPGEVAAAIASILGGLIGAAGTAGAVYLTLSRQREEDRKRIHSALVREVIEFSRLVIGHLETCDNIRTSLIALPVPKLTEAMRMPTPIIYPAVADKIGLLSSPQNAVAFYARIVEVSILLIPTIAADPKLQESTLKEQNVRLLVEAWLDILKFAHWIIADSKRSEDFDQPIREMMLKEIEAQSASARQSFKIDS